MNKKLNNVLRVALLIAAFYSCRPDIKIPAPAKGSLDVSNYVALGNSVTSGYADGALYYDGQLVAYPNLIAQQFKLIGGGVFKEPFVGANSVGIGSSLNARLVLGPSADCKGVISLGPVAAASIGDLSIFATSVASQGPFNNMGVPGAKAITAIYPGYGNPANGVGLYNPFFTRMASNPATASMLSDAAAQKPTFFSLFIGNNDALGYALTGGTADLITPSGGPAGVGFDASVDLIVNTLTASGARGILASVPDITNLPYFTTIPYNGLVLDKASAAALSAAYAPLGITFQEGSNGFIMQDNAAPGGLRQMKRGELLLLETPGDSIKCKGWGSQKPIPDKYVLSATEVAQIGNAVSAYNAKLKSLASAKGLAFVDVNAFMLAVTRGIAFNGLHIQAQFVTGGAFSLDGIHLTPLGNALLANEFIKAINATYGSTIPQIDATGYNGVRFP